MSEDDKKLPSVDDEFAALSSELTRIAGMKAKTAEESNAVLVAMEAVRADWKKRPVRTDLPAWRREVEAAVDSGLDGMIREMQRHVLQGGAPGTETALLQKYAQPVFEVVNSALQRAFVEKFGKKPEPGAPPKKIDAADIAGALFILLGHPTKKP